MVSATHPGDPIVQEDQDKPEYRIGRTEAERLRQTERAFLARPRLSIRLRIVAGFLLCFFLLVVTGLINLFILYQARSKLHFLDVSQDLSLLIQGARQDARQSFPNEQNLEKARASAEQAFQLFISEGSHVLGATSEKDAAVLNFRIGHYVQLLDDGLALTRTGTPSPSQVKALYQRMDTTSEGVMNFLRKLKAQEAESADHVLKLSQELPFLFCAVMLVIIFWITSLLAGTITTSLQRLEDFTSRIAAGDFSLMDPRRRYHDEFSDLALAVNRMLLEMRAREAQVIKADKLASVGIVAAGFAQEAGGVFDAIRHDVDSFVEAPPAGKDCSECSLVKAVDTESQRGKETVDTLLKFALEDRFKLEPVSVYDVTESARRLLEYQIEQAHVVFSNGIPPDMPRVMGAYNHLEHVFLNLFENAIQAMPHGGTLAVRGALLGSKQASVTVSDQGMGIPPEDLAHIFDPFFTTKDNAKGTGLGLSINYGLIKRQGGDIRVESLVGGGTTVHITLPLAA
jgi:two-component system, NtrC family, sensor kinase